MLDKVPYTRSAACGVYAGSDVDGHCAAGDRSRVVVGLLWPGNWGVLDPGGLLVAGAAGVCQRQGDNAGQFGGRAAGALRPGIGVAGLRTGVLVEGLAAAALAVGVAEHRAGGV